MTVQDLVQSLTFDLHDRGVERPPRWAEAIVAWALGVPHAQVRGRWPEAVPEAARAKVDAVLPRVTGDRPVADLIGTAPFLDLDYEVTPDTLVPKVDTELFVRLLLDDCAADLPDRPRVFEVGCGGGCVACAIAAALPGARVLASDDSAAALAVARRNVERHGLADRVEVREGDLLEPARGRTFDLIVSNPPYIPTDRIKEMRPEVAGRDPPAALDGGPDGLDPHRAILAGAADLLAPGGRVYLEHEWYSGDDARRIPDAAVWTDVRTLRDANGRDRALHARLAAR